MEWLAVPDNDREIAEDDDVPRVGMVIKRRNRIPLHWKGLPKEDRKQIRKIDLAALQVFFRRVAPNMTHKMTQLKMIPKNIN